MLISLLGPCKFHDFRLLFRGKKPPWFETGASTKELVRLPSRQMYDAGCVEILICSLRGVKNTSQASLDAK
jgi:hypothetical protein